MARLAIASVLSVAPVSLGATPSASDVREVLSGFFGVRRQADCGSWARTFWSPAGALRKDGVDFVGRDELAEHCNTWQSEAYVRPPWAPGGFEAVFEQSGPYLYVDGEHFFALLVPFQRSVPATGSATVVTDAGRMFLKLSNHSTAWKIEEAVELQATPVASAAVDGLWDSFFTIYSVPSCRTWGELWASDSGFGGDSWVTPQETLSGADAMTGFCSSNQAGDAKLSVNDAKSYRSSWRRDADHAWVTTSNATIFTCTPAVYSALSQEADGSFSIYDTTLLEVAEVEQQATGRLHFRQSVEFQTATNQATFESQALGSNVLV